MREYPVAGQLHAVYDKHDELPSHIEVKSDWLKAKDGDWVRTDDGSIVQLLKVGKLGESKYYRTCTGTYNHKTGLDSVRKDDIYRLNGKTWFQCIRDRKKITAKEQLFVNYLKAGHIPKHAFKKAYTYATDKTCKMHSLELLKQERIQTAMKEDLKPIFDKLGITEEWLARRLKCAAEESGKDEIRLKAIFKLADIMDMEEKKTQKVTQLTGVFKGFSDGQLVAAKREEITDGRE
jgi:hypothetical protein